jgi:hypothetical protein
MFTPRLLCPREGAPGTDWIGGWVGPRTDLDALPVIESGLSSFQPIAIPTELSQPSFRLRRLCCACVHGRAGALVFVMCFY